MQLGTTTEIRSSRDTLGRLGSLKDRVKGLQGTGSTSWVSTRFRDVRSLQDGHQPVLSGGGRSEDGTRTVTTTTGTWSGTRLGWQTPIVDSVEGKRKDDPLKVRLFEVLRVHKHHKTSDKNKVLTYKDGVSG